jgi:programmed cell death 6-interacting protein
MLSVDNMEPAPAVATLRHALEGLSQLAVQRAALEEALKKRRHADNILPRLLSAGAAEAEALFATEVSKYDDLVDEVKDNAAKQAQLLEVAAAGQHAFREAYNFADWRRACEAAATGVRARVALFKELDGNLQEGVRFYSSLQDAVAALRQQVGDHCATRHIQRDEMVEELQRAAAGQEAAAAAAAHMAAMTLQQHHQYQAPPPLQQSGGYGPYSGPPPPPPQQQQQQQQHYGQPQWPPPAYAQQQAYQSPPAPPAGYQAPAQPGYGGQQQYGHAGPPPPQQATPPAPPPQHQAANPLANVSWYGRT